MSIERALIETVISQVTTPGHLGRHYIHRGRSFAARNNTSSHLIEGGFIAFTEEDQLSEAPIEDRSTSRWTKWFSSAPCV
jgi:hypothetical protein